LRYPVLAKIDFKENIKKPPSFESLIFKACGHVETPNPHLRFCNFDFLGLAGSGSPRARL